MDHPTIHPVVLCGGSGTRLWPRSRKAKPKPFLSLVGDRTLFEATIDRWLGQANFAAPVIVAGEDHIDHLAEQSDRNVTIIIEPEAKNTAPAIALAAALLPQDAVMLVCPSDHHIANSAGFIAAARSAAGLAKKDWLVSLGIAPDRPETGYGYIRIGKPIDDCAGYQVDRFVEKPDGATAAQFLAEGGYAWNGGIFAFRAGAYLAELELHRRKMAEAIRRAVEDGGWQGRQFHPAAGPFSDLAGESVDYAVMENTSRAAVVLAEMGWSDIGNWEALRDVRPGDGAGNRTLGNVDLLRCRNVLVETDGPRVSVLGVEDVIVVVDGDEVLVTTSAGAQLVGKLPGATNQ